MGRHETPRPGKGGAKKSSLLPPVLAGAAAGALGGFFGGGGGTVLVPLLRRRCGLDARRSFATSVAIILPLCALSALIYLLRGAVELSAALPYLIGGGLGGVLGGRLFRAVKGAWLQRAFALLILYGGVKALL